MAYGIAHVSVSSVDGVATAESINHIKLISRSSGCQQASVAVAMLERLGLNSHSCWSHRCSFVVVSTHLPERHCEVEGYSSGAASDAAHL